MESSCERALPRAASRSGVLSSYRHDPGVRQGALGLHLVTSEHAARALVESHRRDERCRHGQRYASGARRLPSDASGAARTALLHRGRGMSPSAAAHAPPRLVTASACEWPQSYGGHYVPNLAKAIQTHNAAATTPVSLRIALQGIAGAVQPTATLASSHAGGSRATRCFVSKRFALGSRERNHW